MAALNGLIRLQMNNMQAVNDQQFYQLLADLVLLIHFSIAAFIVIGLLLIIIGGFRNWQWIRNPWFRYAHLIAICFVVLQAWLGQLCPLTILENHFRAQAGEATYPGSFFAYWLGELLYYDFPMWVFVILYSFFGLLVIYCWIKVKPRSSN